MTETFNTLDRFPWFLYNDKTFGFDADIVAEEFLKAGGYLRIYNVDEEQVLSAVCDVVTHVINTSYQYSDESVKILTKRFQIIINGTILEIFLENSKFAFLRASDSKWLLNGTYDTGTDFVDSDGTKIEAKVYYSDETLQYKITAANNGNRYIFHDADYVCCYLINERKYQWLKRINGIYDRYDDKILNNLTTKFLPEQLPLCKCIERNADEWELVPFYTD